EGVEGRRGPRARRGLGGRADAGAARRTELRPRGVRPALDPGVRGRQGVREGARRAARGRAVRAPGEALRRGPLGRLALGAPRPAGHGHRGQGRDRPARRRSRGPAGRGPPLVRRPDARGARARLPVAHPQRPPAARVHRRVRPLALRGRARRARGRARAAGGVGGALRRDQPLRGGGRRGRYDDRQGRAPRVLRGAARTAHGAARAPGQVLEVQPERRGLAPQVARVPGGVPGRPRPDEHRDGAVVRDPRGPQVVRAPRRERAPARRAARARPRLAPGGLRRRVREEAPRGDVIPPGDPEIAFRRLAREDLPTLGAWLAQPHVARWWHHETTPDALERDFGASVRGEEPGEDLVVLVDGVAVGLVQRSFLRDYPPYRDELVAAGVDVPDGAVTLDYPLGDTPATGHWPGTRV